MAVTKDRPSGAIAMPSSDVGPEVTCSGVPLGKRCRQIWLSPTALDVKYIHFPSGDHAATVQPPPGGPTARPGELPSMGTRRQGSHKWSVSISTSRTHFPSGDT